MKALTLWRPWPFAIFHLPPPVAKRVENRSWKPPAWLVGQRIAIHAGKTWDPSGARACIETQQLRPGLSGDMRSEGIIGTAVLCGLVTGDGYWELAEGRLPLGWSVKTISDWYIGPVGWLLDDVRALAEPIPCQGRQGLWDVPAELVERFA